MVHIMCNKYVFLPQSADPPEMISISALEAAQKTQWPPRDQQSHLRPGTPYVLITVRMINLRCC